MAYTASNKTFTITGDSSIAVVKLGTISLDLGGGATSGVVITNGTLTGIGATAALSATLGGGTFSATGVVLSYDSRSDFLVSRPASLKLGSSFDLALTLGTSSSPGLDIENGSLESLVASATVSNANLGGAIFSATGLGLTYS